ncbi:hypothetical protein BVRB_6g145920 [Beta vulgaris subsp. vulgaris]|nr:hypothetical protein BVRB_6g145920 [Beta vulgaris subsp. vulgaris]
MKLVKAMKKLKFWSTKRRMKDNYHYYKLTSECDFQSSYYPPPPPARPPPPRPPTPLQEEGCQCHFCQPAEPSAPPLPPWLEPQLEDISDDSNWINPFSSPCINKNEQELGDHCIHISQELVFSTAADTTSCSSASQQHSPSPSSSVLQQYSQSPSSSALQQYSLLSPSSSELQQYSQSPTSSALQQYSHWLSSSALQQYSPTSSTLQYSQSLTSSALQQYSQSPRREKGAWARGLFGCVFDVGGLFFRCFFPCLNISEHVAFRNDSSVSDHKALAHQIMEKKSY